MAPIGGGPPVGSWAGASGTGNTLNYIGDHAYGYSGNIDITENETIFIKHHTGNEYIVATVTMDSKNTSGIDMVCDIKINGETVLTTRVGDAYQPFPNWSKESTIIIPAFSDFQMSGQLVSSGTVDYNVKVIGRVYSA